MPDTILSVDGLCKRFGDRVVLQGVSFDVGAGEVHGIMGPNGAGKTTCFHTLTGRYRPDAGRVRFEGRDVTGLAPHRLKGIGVARTFQECRVFPQFTCLQNLLFALQLHGLARGARRDEALRMLRLVNLEGYADEPAASLSFGQRRLLEIVGTFVVRPRFLLLDEPAAGVNPMLLETLSRFLRAMYDERPGVFLIVEHNMEFIMQLAGELIVMHQGAILERGAPQDIQRSQQVVEAYLG